MMNTVRPSMTIGDIHESFDIKWYVDLFSSYVQKPLVINGDK